MSPDYNNYYTLFWMPVRKRPFKNECIRESSELVIKDPGFFVENQDLLLYIKKIANGLFNVIVSPYMIEDKAVDLLTLRFVEHDQFGFVEFKVEYAENVNFQYNINEVWSTLSIQIYRLVKNIYHSHKYHSFNEYFIDASIEITSCRIFGNELEINKYHSFYFEYIHKKINEYRLFLLNKVEDRFTLENRFGFFNFSTRKLLFIRKYVDNVVGVLDYLEVLRDVNKDLYEKIEWYSHDIQRIKREVSETYNARRSTSSVFLGYLGLCLGILSFGLSWFWSGKSSNSQLILEQKHDSIIFKQIELIDVNFDQLNRKLDVTDSILFLLKENSENDN